MYGAYFRAAIMGALAPPFAAGLAMLLAPLITQMKAGEYSSATGAQNLIGMFSMIREEFLLIEIASIAMFVLARAFIERRMGVSMT